MKPESAIEAMADEAGWSVETQLALCLEYIENQASDEAFVDFLKQKLDEERDDV